MQKLVLIFLVLLFLVSGCVSSTKSVDPTSFVSSTLEYSKLKGYPDFYQYSTNLSEEQSSENSYHIDEFKNQSGYILVFGSKRYFNSGYVYQLDNNGKIISKTTLDSYRARNGLFLKDIQYNKSCIGSALSLVSKNTRDNSFEYSIKNSGNINYTNLVLVKANGDNYTESSLGELPINSTSSFTVSNPHSFVSVQVFAENCPNTRLYFPIL